MQETIQPKLKEAVISCICGAEYKILSVSGDMKVEVCANCHPFYTGKNKRAAAGGRVERFKRKYGLEENEED